jgi:hypothetical protein
MVRRNIAWICCLALPLMIGGLPSSLDPSMGRAPASHPKLPALQLPSWLSLGLGGLTSRPHSPKPHQVHRKCGNAADPNGTPCP